MNPQTKFFEKLIDCNKKKSLPQTFFKHFIAISGHIFEKAALTA